MAAKKRVDNENDHPSQSGGKNKGGIIKILAIALGSVLTGVLGVVLVAYFFGIPGVVPKAQSAKPPVMEKLDLGERVINLADPGGGRYLRVKMVLEYQQNEKLAEELKEQNPGIMEKILHILRSKTVDDVRPVEKEEKVKAEIIQAINKDLKKGKIERIYFTDFLIQ